MYLLPTHPYRHPAHGTTHAPLCVQFKYMPTSPWCASWDGVVEAITANQTLQPSNADTVRWAEG